MSDDIKIRSIIVDKYMNDSDVTDRGQLEPGRLEFKWQFVKPDGTREELRQFFELTDDDFIEFFKIKIKDVFYTKPTSGDHTIKVVWNLEKGTFEDLKDYKLDLKRKTAEGWEDIASDLVDKRTNNHTFRGTYTGEYVVSVSARGVDDRILGSESSKKVFFEYSPLIEFVDRPEPRYYQGQTLTCSFNIKEDSRFSEARKLTLVLLKKKVSGLFGRETYERVKDLMAWEGDQLITGRKDFSTDVDFDYGNYRLVFEFEGDDERAFGSNPAANFEVYVKEANPLKVKLHLTSEEVYKAGKWPLKLKVEGDPREFNIDKLFFEAMCQKEENIEKQEFEIIGDAIVEGEIDIDDLVEIGPSENAAVKVYALAAGTVLDSYQTPVFEIKDEGEVNLGFVKIPETFYVGESEEVVWEVLKGETPARYRISFTGVSGRVPTTTEDIYSTKVTFDSPGKAIIKVTGLKEDGTEMTWPLEKQVDVVSKENLNFEYTGENRLILGEVASNIRFKIDSPVPEDVEKLEVYLSKTSNLTDESLLLTRLKNFQEGEFVSIATIPEYFGQGPALLLFFEKRKDREQQEIFSTAVTLISKKEFELGWVREPESTLLLGRNLEFSWKLLQGDYNNVLQYVVEVFKLEGERFLFQNELSRVITNIAQSNGTDLIPQELGNYKVTVKLFSDDSLLVHKTEKSFEFEVIPSDQDFDVVFIEVPTETVQVGSPVKTKIRVIKGRGFKEVDRIIISSCYQNRGTYPGYSCTPIKTIKPSDLEEKSEFEVETIADSVGPGKIKVEVLEKRRIFDDHTLITRETFYNVEQKPEDVVLQFVDVPEVITEGKFNVVKFRVGPKANISEDEIISVELYEGSLKRIGTIFSGNISGEGVYLCKSSPIFEDDESIDYTKEYALVLKRWKKDQERWYFEEEDFRAVKIVEQDESKKGNIWFTKKPNETYFNGDMLDIAWDFDVPVEELMSKNYTLSLYNERGFVQGLENSIDRTNEEKRAWFENKKFQGNLKIIPGKYRIKIAIYEDWQNSDLEVFSEEFVVKEKAGAKPTSLNLEYLGEREGKKLVKITLNSEEQDFGKVRGGFFIEKHGGPIFEINSSYVREAIVTLDRGIEDLNNNYEVYLQSGLSEKYSYPTPITGKLKDLFEDSENKKLYIEIENEKSEYYVGDNLTFKIKAYETEGFLGRTRKKVLGCQLRYYTVKGNVQSQDFFLPLDDVLDEKGEGEVVLQGQDTTSDVKYSIAVIAPEGYDPNYKTPYDFMCYFTQEVGALNVTINLPGVPGMEELEVGQNWNLVSIDVSGDYEFRAGEKLILFGRYYGDNPDIRVKTLRAISEDFFGNHTARDMPVEEGHEGNWILEVRTWYDGEFSDKVLATAEIIVAGSKDQGEMSFEITPAASYKPSEEINLEVTVKKSGVRVENIKVGPVTSSITYPVLIDENGKGIFTLPAREAGNYQERYIIVELNEEPVYPAPTAEFVINVEREEMEITLSDVPPQVLVGDIIRLNYSGINRDNVRAQVAMDYGKGFVPVVPWSDFSQSAISKGMPAYEFNDINITNEGVSFRLDPKKSAKKCRVELQFFSGNLFLHRIESNSFDVEQVDIHMRIHPHANGVLEDKNYNIEYHGGGHFVSEVDHYEFSFIYHDNQKYDSLNEVKLGSINKKRGSFSLNPYELLRANMLPNLQRDKEVYLNIRAIHSDGRVIGEKVLSNELYLDPENIKTEFDVIFPEPGLKEGEDFVVQVVAKKGGEDVKGDLHFEINGDSYSPLRYNSWRGGLNFSAFPQGEYQIKFWLDERGFGEENAIVKGYTILPKPSVIEVSNVTAKLVSGNTVEVQWESKGQIAYGTIKDLNSGKMNHISGFGNNRARLEINSSVTRLNLEFDVTENSGKNHKFGPFDVEIQHDIERTDYHKADPSKIARELSRFIQVRNQLNYLEAEWNSFNSELNMAQTSQFKPDLRRQFQLVQDELAEKHNDFVIIQTKIKEINSKFIKVLGRKLDIENVRELSEHLSNFDGLVQALEERGLTVDHDIAVGELDMIKRILSSKGPRAKEGEIDLLENALVKAEEIIRELPQLIQSAREMYQRMQQI